jgi:hypothetical protein
MAATAEAFPLPSRAMWVASERHAESPLWNDHASIGEARDRNGVPKPGEGGEELARVRQ